LQVDVTRRPYSFRGGSQRKIRDDPSASTWAIGLKNHYPGYWQNGKFTQLRNLGNKAGICFDFDTKFNWHPVDSQRMLMFAHSEGKGEEYAEAIGRRHFEMKQSAVELPNLLDAALEVGLDNIQAKLILESSKYEKEVWDSYTKMVHLGIRSIPLFLFWPPGRDSCGPFRAEKESDNQVEPWVVNGSANPETFLEIFETIAHNAPH